MARAYVSALRRAAAADSLMAAIATDTALGGGGDVAGQLATVLYTLGRAQDEYRCGARGMAPFLASRDTAFTDFATETRSAFESRAIWVADVTSELKRKMGTAPRSLVAEAEAMAELRRRRDALTSLMVMNSSGLTFILSEAGPGGQITRLAMTRGQRDSLLASLRDVAAGSTNDAPSAARVLIEWLKQTWDTR